MGHFARRRVADADRQQAERRLNGLIDIDSFIRIQQAQAVVGEATG